MRRLEDPRLLRGRGRYLDDIVLPRMLALSPSSAALTPHAGVVADRRGGRPRAARRGRGPDRRRPRRCAPLAPRLDGRGLHADRLAAAGRRARCSSCGAGGGGGRGRDAPTLAADARDLVRVAWTRRSRPMATSTTRWPPGGVLVPPHRPPRRRRRASSPRAVVTCSETFTHGRLRGGADGAARRRSPTGTARLSPCGPRPRRRRSSAAALAAALGLAQSRVRVIVPDVGGGFGLKVHVLARGRRGGRGGAPPRAPGEVGRGAAARTSPRRSTRASGAWTSSVAADDSGRRARAARARRLRRRRLPRLSAHRGAGAARRRVDPAGALPRRGLRVGSAGGADPQAARSAPIAEWA